MSVQIWPSSKGLIALSVIAGSFVLPLNAIAQTQAIDPPDSPAYHVSVPAGPFSVINTMSGDLTTTLPFFSLKGKGRTGLSFNITHRSQATELLNQKRQVARGWNHNYFEYMRRDYYNYDINGSNPDECIVLGNVLGRSGGWDRDAHDADLSNKRVGGTFDYMIKQPRSNLDREAASDLWAGMVTQPTARVECYYAAPDFIFR